MSTVKPVKVALIGSGNISYTYLNTLVKGGFNIIDVVGCSDLIPERSKARAELFGIRQMTNEEILNDPEIEIVINTTQLWNHTAVTRQILEAGKNVYSEKAMGDTLEGAKANYELAASKGLRLGCAPDCYMGAAFQTARKLLDDGAIGRPLIAHAMCYRGYNSHYAAGDPADPSAGSAGTTITHDMGGYYINVLVNMLGAVNRVSGYTKFYDERVYENPRHPPRPSAPQQRGACAPHRRDHRRDRALHEGQQGLHPAVLPGASRTADPRLLRRQHRRGFDRQHSLISPQKEGRRFAACPFVLPCCVSPRARKNRAPCDFPADLLY